jgi:hypothetical protein
LASAYLHNKKTGDFKPVCDQWVGTIGNFRAWRAEDNRSEQEQSAKDKIGDDKEKQLDSFLEADELSGFSGGDSGAWNIRHLERPAHDYINVCRRRLLRIYSEWYESVGVAKLIVAAEDSKPRKTEITETIVGST